MSSTLPQNLTYRLKVLQSTIETMFSVCSSDVSILFTLCINVPYESDNTDIMSFSIINRIIS